MINFQFFPRSHGLTPEMKQIVADFDTHKEAMSRCRVECKREMANYEKVSNCKATLSRYEKTNFSGCLMTTSDKCVEWHFLSRVIAVSAMSTDTIRCLET